MYGWHCNLVVVLGDDTLKMAVENDDSINMSMVYNAMDLYKKAVVATREVEVVVITDSLAVVNRHCYSNNN